MAPAAKFYALVTSATIGIMLTAVTYILPFLQMFSAEYKIAAVATGIIVSVGIYRLVALIAETIIRQIPPARRWIFGGSHLHGTWVGFFIGRAGDKRFMLEHFDQDLDGLVINGQSYTDALNLHADWTSMATSVDARNGRLIFTYTLTIHSRSGTVVGVNSSQLERSSHRHPATSIVGHAQDLGDTVRVQVREVKISDKLLPWSKALEEAQRHFP